MHVDFALSLRLLDFEDAEDGGGRTGTGCFAAVVAFRCGRTSDAISDAGCCCSGRAPFLMLGARGDCGGIMLDVL